jgi:hypothetical protein
LDFPRALDQGEIDRRITFHDADQVMEVSFENLALADSREVNAFYDRLEERIAETGEELWFFLVNYSSARIDSSAWFAFARRGKQLNLAHSMGSVRFDVSEATRRQIERDADTEAFDPNLFSDRESALDHLRSLVSGRVKPRPKPQTHFTEDVLSRRLHFFPDAEVMDVNFAEMVFRHSVDVDFVFDFIEARIAETARKWYFLVNYEATEIEPRAWVEYARRGKALNEAWSLGSVRYAPGSETAEQIRMRAQSQDFRPNIRNTREEAIERIQELKRA